MLDLKLLEKTAPDFNILNAPALTYLTRHLGDRPGSVRRENGDIYGNHAIGMAMDAYKAQGLGGLSCAAGLNRLAQQVLRFGYGREAIQISQASDTLDAGKVLAADNMRAKAHAVGLIDGEYMAGYALYRQAEFLQRNSDQWDDTAYFDAQLDHGRICYHLSKTDPRYLIAAFKAYSDLEGFLSHTRIPAEEQDARALRKNYDQAKTMIRMARINPYHIEATNFMHQAIAMAAIAQSAASRLPGAAFERACVKATQAEIVALTTHSPEAAIAMLKEALAEQVAANPTAMPRLVATEAKICLLEGEKGLGGKMADAIGRLSAFYGNAKHPAIAYYGRRFAANSGPRPWVFIAPRGM